VLEKASSRLLALGAGALLLALIPFPALPGHAGSFGRPTFGVGSASEVRSWPDFRNHFLKAHPRSMPEALEPPIQAVTVNWVRALGRYFEARKRAIARIRRAYLRMIARLQSSSVVAPVGSTVPAGVIRTAVEKAFGSEAEHALAVMQCENPGLDPTAIHHDSDGSSDWGLFQINIVYNRGAFDYAEHLLDPWYNIAVAANVYRSRGWGDWTCGRILGLA
jgi:Lysozyme like domain